MLPGGNLSMDFAFVEDIQFGFDIATSISIIFAGLAVTFSSVYRVIASKRQGINERVKATSLEKVISIKAEFEDAFSAMVDVSTKLENPIDRWAGRSEGYTALADKVGRDPAFLERLVEKTDEFKEAVGNYYESIEKRRYTLIPVLDSIPGQQQFLKVFLADMADISRMYNSMAGGHFSLLREVSRTQQFADQLLQDVTSEETSERLDVLLDSKEFQAMAYSVISDSDYLEWTRSLCPDEKETEFQKLVESGELMEKDFDLFRDLMLNFSLGLISRPNVFIAQILVSISRQVQQARIECKDILIKLAAMSHKLLSKDNGASLMSIIEKYEGDDYFGRNTLIR